MLLPTPNAVRPRDALLLLPLAAAAAFVLVFARSLPLTDEWFYVRALQRLHDVDWHSLAGWGEAIRLYPYRWNEHIVAFPFLLYAPVAEAAHYDSRWVIALTVAAFAGHAWLYRATMVRSAWAALPITLVLFCPSHYMEFLWGWQVTLTFSVVLSLVGLAAIDGIGAATTGRARAGRAATGLALILLGLFSSAGAFFAFASAMLILALARVGWRAKGLMLGTCAITAGVVYLGLMRSGPPRLAFGWRETMDVCTALGATLWGSPVGLSQFGLDARSGGGLAILVLTAVVIGRAVALRTLSKLALPLGVTLMRLLCMASIALARPYLGNWHVQYALPAVCGAYAAAYALWRLDRTLWAAVPFLGLTALLVSSVFGYWEGFTRYGPEYRGYTRSIEDYQLRNLLEPGLPAPYPPQGWNDMDARLLLFLAAHGQPRLAARAPVPSARPLPAGARVFRDEAEAAQPMTVEGGCRRLALLTVVIPGSTTAHGVQARIGTTTVRLWRVHPQHVPAAARLPDATSFMALIVPHRLPAGRHAVDFELLD